MAAPFLMPLYVLFIVLAACWRPVTAQSEAIVLHDDGCVHMPIVHSTNVRHLSEKRGIQVQLANRSDVAYYAQRTPSPLSTSARGSQVRSN